jgi:hypothetical protein
LLLVLVSACSAGDRDPLVGIFSAKQVAVPGGRPTDETLRLKVIKAGEGYGMAIWDPGKESWKDLRQRVVHCTFSEVAGSQSKETDSVVGACIENAKSGLFYLRDPSLPHPQVQALAKLIHTHYALFLAFPGGGTIWEAQRE